MSIAQLKQRIMDNKPTELAHLYIDGDDQLRDRHIEAMFNTLFYGEEIDTEFRTNFSLYAKLLFGAEYLPPEEAFVEPSVAIGWISTSFGLCHVSGNVTGDTSGDPDLAHCTHRARLRSRFDPDSDDAYGPSALHAALLSVVIVFRNLAARWHEEQFGK